MTVTSGFFNSLNGDRRYDADQFGSIFDGVINDGIYAAIGDAFAVYALSGNTVRVGTGRAWFKHTWIVNDSLVAITLPAAEMLTNRYDMICIEVNKSDSVRRNTIKVVSGTPAQSPSYPSYRRDSTNLVWQYPLCYIYRPAGSTSVTQSNIVNNRGYTSCPFVTGILSVLTIDSIVAQWNSQWSDWMANRNSEYTTYWSNYTSTADAFWATYRANAESFWSNYESTANSWWSSFTSSKNNAWSSWFNGIKGDWDDWYSTETSADELEWDNFIANHTAAFNNWMTHLDDLVDEDTAARLLLAVVELQDKFVELTENDRLWIAISDENGEAVEDTYGDALLIDRVVTFK